MRDALGGKGAGLAEMTASGISVPPGLTIATSVCRQYYDSGKTLPAGLFDEVLSELAQVEAAVGRRLGDVANPLLLSVRSGAKFSMPGMMDTILNLGLNDETVEGLAAKLGERFALDSYRRFIQMYGNVVLDLGKDEFEDLLHLAKVEAGVDSDADLTPSDLRALIVAYKRLVFERVGVQFPQDTHEQLRGAVEAVFRSWNNERAIYYRNLNGIDHTIGTAVTVQAMVFGNLNDQSATGVCFTRNPSTGEPTLYGEYLVNAQGEDVVAGTRTPKPIGQMAEEMPHSFSELLSTTARLEAAYLDVQDVEFTIESGKLYILQTRTGKRTAAAAVRIAVDLANEGVISRQTAITRVEPGQLNQLLLPSFAGEALAAAKMTGRHLATGLAASPGAAVGKIIFDPDEAAKLGAAGEKVILVRIETCPDDIHGIVPAQGIVTARGGMTSHAAVVARGMGKPCVSGCEALKIDLHNEVLRVDGRIFRKNDVISINGSNGEIYEGAIPSTSIKLSSHFHELLSWADGVRELGIRTNADTPEDASLARSFGAEGVGLCRTEHMFMSQDRLPIVQKMILDTSEGHAASAWELLPFQREDFAGIFRAMAGLPVTIRLLDPPLHEFLPKADKLKEEIAELRPLPGTGDAIAQKEALLARVEELHESNPMMGLRGCRLGLLYPEINEMQVKAIFEAAAIVTAEGIEVHPEIMIPLVGVVEELELARQTLERVAEETLRAAGVHVDYKFGTMIEVPRAALTADEIAAHAEFFSFGTNDLTQMTFGYSRDDAEGRFLQHYLDGVKVNGTQRKVLTRNPFEVLDQKGVGKLMKIAVEGGRSTRPDLKIGICGEHGGEPSSIAFARQLGLNYVSCSPYRVPVARLAAAQASIASSLERDR
jgi:pyruvate,orthophosphate dikinase